MADIEARVRPVEVAVIGIEQSEVEVVVALAERRAQVILRARQRIAPRQAQPESTDVAVLCGDDDAVIQRTAAVAAAVDRRILRVLTARGARIAEIHGARAWTVEAIDQIQIDSPRTAVVDADERVGANLLLE